MAAGIAHEINQPLSAIATYAQAGKRVLQRDKVDVEMVKEVLAKIDDQARRAGQIIANIRKFIRKQEIETQSLDIALVIADVMTLIEADASSESIRVHVRIADGLAPVRADAGQLQQVLLNLTRNAVDAMRRAAGKERGIIIAADAAESERVRITVTDHGHGVSPQLGENIFHPFITTKRDGLGVGLAISRTIVQSYGGTLTYADNPVGGSIFTIELPQNPQPDLA
jgi:C4-dicarboxylate-specific signal transduction histidine kinase